MSDRRQLVEKHPQISRKRQCELLEIPRSSSYYKSVEGKEQDRRLEEPLNALYEQDPCLGERKLARMLERDYGLKAGRKKIRRLKREMGLRTIYRNPRTCQRGRRQEGRYPYTVPRNREVKVNEVWTSDITYIQIGSKNYYLCSILDWGSRAVLSWQISERMSTELCTETLKMALSRGVKPKIMNTDQGSQYTSHEWQRMLIKKGIEISQDGKGCWRDNAVMERFWRTYKHDFYLLHEPQSAEEVCEKTATWMEYYNHQRPHETLGYRTPSEHYEKEGGPPAANFFSAPSATLRLAPLRVAPALRAGKGRSYATWALKKWLD